MVDTYFWNSRGLFNLTTLFLPLKYSIDYSTGVGCHFLLQGIFLTQGLNPGLPHCIQSLYHLSHQGSPILYIYFLKLEYNCFIMLCWPILNTESYLSQLCCFHKLGQWLYNDLNSGLSRNNQIHWYYSKNLSNSHLFLYIFDISACF